MPDATLISKEIKKAVQQEGLLTPFDEGRLKGASYDFAVGRTIIIVHPRSEGGIVAIDLAVCKSWQVPPGRAAIVYSLESVNMPHNMKGRLALRSRLATKLWFFAGGQIDPGYKGCLYLPLANLSDVPLSLTYGEPVVSGEFVRIGERTWPYSSETFCSIPEDRLPEPPPEIVYNVADLTTLVTELQSHIEKLRGAIGKMEPRMEATTMIVNGVVLAAIAGILAGVVAGAIISLFN